MNEEQKRKWLAELDAARKFNLGEVTKEEYVQQAKKKAQEDQRAIRTRQLIGKLGFELPAGHTSIVLDKVKITAASPNGTSLLLEYDDYCEHIPIEPSLSKEWNQLQFVKKFDAFVKEVKDHQTEKNEKESHDD